MSTDTSTDMASHKQARHKTSMEVDAVMGMLGGYGVYQMITFSAIAFIDMRGAWHVMSLVFMGAKLTHHCTVSGTLNDTIPQILADDGSVSWSQCEMFINTSVSNDTASCQNGWIYDNPDNQSTIQTEWDLVCDDDYLIDLSLTIFMVGTMCGAMFLTPLSDIFGRKVMLLSSLWLQTALGFGLAFIDDFTAFTVMRFFIGALNNTIALVGYVLMTEVFPGSHRTKPSIIIQISWAMGIMIIAGLAYLLPDWRHLEMAISLPSLITIAFYWILPESIPWLVASGKIKTAEALVQRAAKMNKKFVPTNCFMMPPCEVLTADNQGNINQFESDHDKLRIEANAASHYKGNEKSTDSSMNSRTELHSNASPPKYTVLDLFRTYRMRLYVMVMIYLWLANSLSYYGISFSVVSLHGNPYLNFFLSGVVEIPAYIVCTFAISRFGRKLPLIMFMVMCGICNIVILAIPDTDSAPPFRSLVTALAMIGKFSITGSYSIVYLYCAEILPTVVRNQGLGLSSIFENLGGICAPFIVYSATSIPLLPRIIFGVMPLIGGALALLLPETNKRPLPQTIEEIENWTNDFCCKHGD